MLTATPPPSAEHGRLISKLASIAELDDADRQAISGLPLRTRSVEAGVDLIAEGAAPTECCFVVEGLVSRYSITANGARQIVSFHIAGDLPDRDSIHLFRLDHTIASISPARVAFIPHADLARAFDKRPRISVALWRDAVVDGGVYRQWLTSVGRRTAKQRIAHLVCEVFARMRAVGLADDDHFSFPVTQVHLGDALGLSAVHINRTLQELRQDGVIAWRGTVVTIPDWDALAAAGDFDPSYLKLRTAA